MSEAVAIVVDSKDRVQCLRTDGFARYVYQNTEADYAKIGDLTISPTGEIYLIETASDEDRLVSRLLHAKGINEPFERIHLDVDLKKIDAGPGDALYGIDSNGRVLDIHENGTYTELSGEDFAMEISAGPDGTVWVVGYETNDVVDEGGNFVHFYEDGKWKALNKSILAKRITGKANGDAIIVKSDGDVCTVGKSSRKKKVDDLDFRKIATDISIGPEGILWMVTNHPCEGGSYIMYSENDGETWSDVPFFGGVKLDAGRFNN